MSHLTARAMVGRAAAALSTVALVAAGLAAPAGAAIRQEPTIALGAVTCEEGHALASAQIQTNWVTGSLTSLIDGNTRGTTGLTGTDESLTWAVSLRDLPANKSVTLSFNLDNIPVAGASFPITVPECADNAATWPTFTRVFYEELNGTTCDWDAEQSLALFQFDSQGAYGQFTGLVNGKVRTTRTVTERVSGGLSGLWHVPLDGFPAGKRVTIQFAVNGVTVPGVSFRVTVAKCTDNATAVVKVTAKRRASVLHVDVNPDRGGGYWRFRVERKKADGTWASKGTYRTVGSKETRTLNFTKGTYRVVVLPKYGYLGTRSAPVTLQR